MIRSKEIAPLLLALFVSMMAVLPTACAKDDGPGGNGPPNGNLSCEGRDQCEGGLVCIDKVCSNCRGDGDCEFNERCNAASLVCEFRKGWGNDCTTHTDCSLGLSCSQGLCQPTDLTVECGPMGQCPEGMRCNKPLFVCEEDLGCKQDDDCAGGEVCNVGTAQCVLGCTAETEGEICAARERCSNGICVECEADSDCNPGFTCHPAAGRCIGSSACITDRDCAAGLVCNRSTKSCTTPPPPCFHDRNCLGNEYCDVRRQVCLLRECTGDIDSPNGTQEFAAQLRSGIRSELRACQLEEKWYKIALQRGDRLNIRVEADVLSADGMNAQIRDEVGNVLAEDPFLLDATVGVDGTYYLVVRTLDAQVRYSLNVLVAKGEPCDDDRYKGNDTVLRAAPLQEGTEIGLIRCPSTADYYVVDVPQGKGIQVTLNHDPLKGLLDLVLRDSDGQRQLAIDASTNGDKTVSSSAITQGRAFVLVYAPDGRVRNTYDLTIGTF